MKLAIRLVSLAAALFFSAAAHAACPVIPFVFKNGTPIQASQINDNFSTLRDCISTATPIVSVSNTAALRNLQAGVYPFVQRSYNSTPGDGAAIYYWSSGSACTDDGQNCIKPASNPPTGRWIVSSDVANNLLLNPGGTGGEFLVVPTNQTAPGVSYQVAATGTVASTPTDTAAMALAWFRQEGALKGLGLNHSIGTFEADYVDTTTLNNDDVYTGVTGNCNITGAKGVGTITGTSCVGVVAAARGLASQGGVPGTPYGGIHGINIVSGLTVGSDTPANYNNVVGAEVDIAGCNGCTMGFRGGYLALDFGDGAGGPGGEQGSTVDAAIAIGSVGGSPSWLYGIDFIGTPIYNGNALSANSDGTVLGSSATSPVVAKYGIDLNNFSGMDFAFRCPGATCSITGAGNITGQAIVATNDLSVDAAGGSPAVIQLRSATVPKWEIDRDATTDDFSINNLTAMTTDFRIVAATGLVKIGNAGSVTIDATGGVTMPGLSAIAVVAGSVCASASGELIYKVGANCF